MLLLFQRVEVVLQSRMMRMRPDRDVRVRAI